MTKTSFAFVLGALLLIFGMGALIARGQSSTTLVFEQTNLDASTSQKAEGAERVASEKKTPGLKIVDLPVSFGFVPGVKKSPIDTIVLHSSYNSTGGDTYDLGKVLDLWQSYRVAPHYVIDRGGTVYRLLADNILSKHAGISEVSDGRTNVNEFSVGIELLNTPDDNYTDAQYEAVNELVNYLKSKYQIKYVVGHSDIAPGRKSDPWNFDWKRLQ